MVILIPLLTAAQSKLPADFSSYFQEYSVKGSFVLYDLTNKKYTVYKQSDTMRGVIPASTFKMPNSLIALELGIVEDENTIMKWDGTERSIAAWNKDMTFGEAIKVSCVPCYQEIARQVGVKRYHKLLKNFVSGRWTLLQKT